MHEPKTSPCDRFHADGSACTNLTSHADGWCREPGCGGFRRSSTSIAPSVEGVYRGTPKHIEATACVCPGPLDIDEVPHVRVTQRAIDSFRFHHGGPAVDAEVELRVMLEDFLLRSAHHRSPGGYLSLQREGYTLVLSPDRSSLVDYQTMHRERTWSQVKAGVPTRFKKNKPGR